MNKAGYRKEISDAFYLMLLQGVNYLIPLVLIPYLMIHLGAEHYGHIGFATAFIQYIMLITDFGFNLSATKRIAVARSLNDEEEINRVFSSTLRAKIQLLALSTVCFAAICIAVPKFRVFAPTVACMYPMALGTAFTFTWLFQGLGKIRILSIINTLSKLLVLPLIFVFVKDSSDTLLAALFQGLTYLLAALISLWIFFRNKMAKWVSVSREQVNEALKESSPLFLSTVSTSVYTQLFTVILALIVSPVALGCYSAAERLMRAGCFVLYTPINQAFYPKVAATNVSNGMEGRALIRTLLRVVAVVMLAVAVVMFFGAPFIEKLAGTDYVGLKQLLRIMSIAPLAIGLGGVLGQMGLVASGDGISEKAFRNTYFCAAPVSLVLLIALSLPLGISGAAIALTLTEVFVAAMMFISYLNKLKRWSSSCQ